MPNRVMKESIKRSPQIDQLTWFEEVLFYRLIVTVDDYGCTDGRTVVVRSDLFPTKENITKKAIDEALDHIEKLGLIRRYTVDGVVYLFIPTFEKHQRVRNKKRKFPAPPPELFSEDCGHLSDNCQSIDGQMTDTCLLESNPIQYESESNPNPNICTEQNSAQNVEAVILNTGEDWRPTVAAYEEYCRLYPGVDVAQEFRKMRGWCKSNPTKRKTIKGVERFVTGWLSRAQDSCRGKPRTSAYMDAIKNRVDVVDSWLEDDNDQRGFCNSCEGTESGVHRSAIHPG